MRTCRCDPPAFSADPRHPFTCNRCQGKLDPDGDYAATDRTHNEFLDRLEGILREKENWPHDKPLPAEWSYFRNLSLKRERVGRARNGPLAHLAKDNLREGTEEDNDGCTYAHFDLLQSRFLDRDPDMDLVLQAAFYDYMAYKARLALRARRHGAAG